MKQLFSDIDKRQQKNLIPAKKEKKRKKTKCDHSDFLPRDDFYKRVPEKRSKPSLVVSLTEETDAGLQGAQSS